MDRLTQLTRNSTYLFAKYILGFPFEISKGQRAVYDAIDAGHYNEVMLVIGRKGTKTTMSSVLTLKRLYMLLTAEVDPRRAYKVLPDATIYNLLVSVDEDQAINVGLDYIRSMTENSWYLADCLIDARMGSGELEFDNNIVIRAQSSSSRAARGYPCYTILMDEIAHFLDTRGNLSGSMIYNALRPNLRVFGQDGLLIMLSSPAGKSGIFWDKYKWVMEIAD